MPERWLDWAVIVLTLAAPVIFLAGRPLGLYAPLRHPDMPWAAGLFGRPTLRFHVTLTGLLGLHAAIGFLRDDLVRGLAWSVFAAMGLVVVLHRRGLIGDAGGGNAHDAETRSPGG